MEFRCVYLDKEENQGDRNDSLLSIFTQNFTLGKIFFFFFSALAIFLIWSLDGIVAPCNFARFLSILVLESRNEISSL